jgi:hypothetical protein
LLIYLFLSSHLHWCHLLRQALVATKWNQTWIQAVKPHSEIGVPRWTTNFCSSYTWLVWGPCSPRGVWQALVEGTKKKLWCLSQVQKNLGYIVPWVEMLKIDYGEIHRVKCIVCSTMKGKDVILGPKFDTLEKHARKLRQFETCHIWARSKRIYMSTKNVVMRKMR